MTEVEAFEMRLPEKPVSLIVPTDVIVPRQWLLSPTATICGCERCQQHPHEVRASFFAPTLYVYPQGLPVAQEKYPQAQVSSVGGWISGIPETALPLCSQHTTGSVS